MTAAEIRGIHMPADALLQSDDCLRLIFEALTEIAAQLSEHNERENEAQSFVREGTWRRAAWKNQTD